MRQTKLSMMVALILFAIFLLRLANAEFVEIEARYLTQPDAERLATFAIENDIAIHSIKPSHELRNEKTIRLGVYEQDQQKLDLLRQQLRVIQVGGKSPNLRVLTFKECHLVREVWCSITGSCHCAEPSPR